MPGVRTRVKPTAAIEYPSTASDEVSILELHLQRQLEEDVARIFDESIYSDVEVVCGKLKILTHSCILKTRTKHFYRKLETILQLNIERSTFDEIYSFISDAYTECDIKHQENEIITYLNDKLHLKSSNITTDDPEETDIFLTPKCVSPYIEKVFQKPISSSPSTELTKEYYALVPIDGNILEKELIEQDVLSNAFQSIINSQTPINLSKLKGQSTECIKPTTLYLDIKQTKRLKHSTSCDTLSNPHLGDKHTNDTSNVSAEQNIKSKKLTETEYYIYKNFETVADKAPEINFSPDSLITDDPSSSSDYLSAAYTCSPGASSSGCFLQLNVDNIVKVENIVTSSDSGLLESYVSQKDVTMADLSLTESTLQDLITDEASNSHDSMSNPIEKNEVIKKQDPSLQATSLNTISGEHELNGSKLQMTRFKENLGCKSSKEEKQRQNEEIVILESSSLSSETGSWESVFPPRLSEKDICEKFINHERQYQCEQEEIKSSHCISDRPSLVQKSLYKATSCFIDAASLADDNDDDAINIHIDTDNAAKVSMEMVSAPSQPVPCCSNKLDLSPNDWSESNDNEDSLENKDVNSIQKDVSPTIFEMTPITEDSLSTNAFNTAQDVNVIKEDLSVQLKSGFHLTSTPHNSLKAFKCSSEDGAKERDVTVHFREGHLNIKKLKKCNESSPILSGGASVEDHLPQMSSYSPMSRRRVENIPIVSGAFTTLQPKDAPSKSPKPSCAETWTVDMSEKNEANSRKLNNEQKSKGISNTGANNESDSEKSYHKFYIDLGTLSVTTPKQNTDSVTEKKNIFSMFIDLGENTTVKEMPSKLKCVKSTCECVTVSDSQHSDSKTFEKYETLCNNPNISISEIIALPKKTLEVESEKLSETVSLSGTGSVQNGIESHNTKTLVNEKVTSYETLKPTIQDEVKGTNHEEPSGTQSSKQYKQEHTVKEDAPVSDLFVKLSDLDKPLPRTESTVKKPEKILDARMTRSIPENNWGGQNHGAAPISMEVISSFHSENALSLNRLFPHLQNEFSRSMPGSLSSRTRSPLRAGTSSSAVDADEQASDMSEMSSVQSSACRSVVGFSTEETSQTSSIIDHCQSRLGQDLLRMFLEEIAPDVIVEVSGRRIKAHKCILSSRCQYFAGILSGGWVESAGNVILLPPFAYNVVHFAMCHIYSGTSTIPDSISIVELATLADMLGLEGLKEAIMFTLKSKYCHHFHRPCAVCTAGVLECFPLSSLCGLDDLYHKCLRWITKYFSMVWPSRAFATLPAELLERCYQQPVVNLTIENLADTVCGAGITMLSLNASGRGECETVMELCKRLIMAAAKYAAPRLVAVLRAVGPLPADLPACALRALDDCLLAAIRRAPPDESCRAYAFLSAVVRDIRNQQLARPDLLANGRQNIKIPGEDTLLFIRANAWRLQCETSLVEAAPRVVNTQAFMDLPPDLRKRLRDMGCIMYGTHNLPVTASPIQTRRSPSVHGGKSKSHNYHVDIDQMRAAFVPYSTKPTNYIPTRDVLRSSNDLRDRDNRKSNKTSVPKVKTTKAQEERAKYNMAKNTQIQERQTTKAPPRLFENAKPRYLEPKMQKSTDKKMPPTNKLGPKMISSSESSRNSSPVQVRSTRASRMKSRQINDIKGQAMSQDSLATSSRPRTAEPSTDSLSESQTSNKYATYTKAKHSKGSIESVQTSKSQVSVQSSVNKGKTKIPVSINNNMTKSKPVDTRPSVEIYKRANAGNTAMANSPWRNKNERKIPGSLMNATKSSSAKVVQRVVKEAPAKTSRHTKANSKPTNREQTSEIPAMDRSGTFLKDEPTFGEKTTNLDIDDQ